MRQAILIDMNLSPRWVTTFQNAGWSSVHWSSIGDPCAADKTIMEWAAANAHIVFTNDLDFGAMLALSQRGKPSVVQLRTQDVMPESGSANLLTVLERFEVELEAGALLIIDSDKHRVRLLPL